ncbi:MAG: hypothetical protein AAF665_15355 [Pseudomonadota bacterium]
MRPFAFIIACVAGLLLAGCVAPPRDATQADIDALAAELKSLGANVDPVEAERAAYLAYTYPLQLAEEYNITDTPIIHNAKVNNGLRPRGICVHWAEDMESRLKEENFRTLQIHRAIAEGSEIRIDHSTAIISQRGDGFEDGVVLDPWRYGGRLYWAPTLEDSKYFWEPRVDVLHRKYQRRIAPQDLD